MAKGKAVAKIKFPGIVWAVIEGDEEAQYTSFYHSIEDLPNEANGAKVMVYLADQEYTLKVGKVLV